MPRPMRRLDDASTRSSSHETRSFNASGSGCGEICTSWNTAVPRSSRATACLGAAEPIGVRLSTDSERARMSIASATRPLRVTVHLNSRFLASHTVQGDERGGNSSPTTTVDLHDNVGVEEHAPGRQIARQRRTRDHRRTRGGAVGDIWRSGRRRSQGAAGAGSAIAAGVAGCDAAGALAGAGTCAKAVTATADASTNPKIKPSRARGTY